VQKASDFHVGSGSCLSHCTLSGSSSLSVQVGTFHGEKSIENTWQIWSGP
jgi:hypothetical protein